MRRSGFNTVRNRLVLLFFAITSAAVGFVYIYVVPQLSSSLTAERLGRLERRGAAEAGTLQHAADRGLDQRDLGSLLRRTAATVDARVTLLGVRDGRPQFVVADSELEADAVVPDYPAATGAAISGGVRSGVETVDGKRVGETAVPIFRGTEPIWVAVLSTPLDDVSANVALIRRQILIAGTIGILAALIAGSLAARAHSRRLRRLEDAAEQVAEGNFRVPIPIDSTDEVGQLAMTFDLMQRRLARLDSARREFIANASHELRTPIASLGGFVELLEDEDPDPETRREFVRTMRGQVDRLTKLTADLLDLSKLDADALELSTEPVDLAAVAAEIAGEFAVAAAEHQMAIEVGAPQAEKPLADADPVRVAQIMRILIDNALKHTPQGTQITITTTTSAESCQVSVIDDGPGLEPEARQQVFDRFFTADSISGSGLGLAIARELARLMGGEVSVESHRGRTAFTLSLPRAAEVASA